MKWFKTLRVRFALWVAILILAVLLIFGSFVYFNLKAGLSSEIDNSLRVGAGQALSTLEIKDGLINFSDNGPQADTVGDLKASGITVRVLSLHGEILQAFGPFQTLPIDSAVSPGLSEFTTISAPSDPYEVRIYTTPIEDNGKIVGFLQVIQSLEPVIQALNKLMTGFFISVPLLLFISTLSGYGLAARALAPIDQMTRTAQRISARDLSDRLNIAYGDDEVGRLANTFDSMLGRLEKAFKRERQFTSDASHELRTPVTAIETIVSVTRDKQRTLPEYEKALDDISYEADRLRNLAESLLQLARLDSQPLQQVETVDISTLLEDVAISLKPLAEEKGLLLSTEIAPNLLVSGDGDALIRVFINLLENAIKYTETGSIHLTAHIKDTSFIWVKIADTGQGISAELLPLIFERFFMIDPSRYSQGAGLGLAIVKEIVRAHDGNIQVESIPGKGSIFTLEFPRLISPDQGG